MELRNRSISRYDVETLFTDVLTLSQIEEIGNLLKILGRYVFLERGQLDHFAERIYGEKIGLSFLHKAVTCKLVAEIQDDKNDSRYYFQLKSGGFYFLESVKFPFRRLPIDAGKKEREKILAINEYIIKKNYLLSAASLALYEPLVTTCDCVLIDNLSEDSVRDKIEKRPMPRIEKMQLKAVSLDQNSKGNVESMLDDD